VGFAIGLTLLGVPETPTHDALDHADEAVHSMTWLPACGSPARFVNIAFCEAFDAIVAAFIEELAAEQPEVLEAYNAAPKPFVWTASAEDILRKVSRARVALQPITT
jgi:hypothetical protein